MRQGNLGVKVIVFNHILSRGEIIVYFTHKASKKLIKSSGVIQMNENNSNITEELIQRGFIVDEKTKAVKGFNANEFALYVKSRMYIIYAKDCYFYLYGGGVWTK